MAKRASGKRKRKVAPAEIEQPAEIELPDDPGPEPAIELDGLKLYDVYYYRGSVPKHWGVYPSIKEPPNSGQSTALVIDPGGASEKRRLTLFCPYTLQDYKLPVDAIELRAELLMTASRRRWFVEKIREKWEQSCRFGWQRSYDVAALVLTRLGGEVPTTAPAASEEVRARREEKRGGKRAGRELVKPVRKESKRGQVAALFLEQNVRSLREAMARLGMTRSGVLTHLFGLHRDHGLGYELTGDTATVTLPKGVETPFGEPAPSEKTRAPQTKGAAETIAPLKAGTKRAAVATALYKGERPLQEVADEVGCTVASVRSHLHDLHSKHGIGFAVTGATARLVVPKGWKP